MGGNPKPWQRSTTKVSSSLPVTSSSFSDDNNNNNNNNNNSNVPSSSTKPLIGEAALLSDKAKATGAGVVVANSDGTERGNLKGQPTTTGEKKVTTTAPEEISTVKKEDNNNKHEKIKAQKWTQAEKELFCSKFNTIGKNWSEFCKIFPNKSRSSIKNFFQNYKVRLGLQ